MDIREYIQDIERILKLLKIELDSQTRKAESEGNDPKNVIAWLESDSQLLNAYVAIKGLDEARDELIRLKSEFDYAVLKSVGKLYERRPAKIPDEISGPLGVLIELERIFDRPPRQLDKAFITGILQKHDRRFWKPLQSGLKQLVGIHKSADRYAHRNTTAWHREFQTRIEQVRASTQIWVERQKLEHAAFRYEADQRKVLRVVAERLCIDLKDAVDAQALVVKELEDLIPLSEHADLLVKQQQNLLIKSYTDSLREQVSEYELKLTNLKAQLAEELAAAKKQRLAAEHQQQFERFHNETQSILRTRKPDYAIQKFAQSRSIRGLVHFTQISNLPDISRHGILSRHACETLSIDTVANDCERFDKLPDFISLSVSWPNWELFYRFRKNTESGDDQWCVLVLNPNILWTFDCIFTAHNAAASTESHRSIDERKGLAAFERLFDDTGGARLGLKRAGLNIPENMPTCHQAEVMVRRCVPWDRVLRIVVISSAAMHQAKAALPQSAHQMLKINQEPFVPRCDWVKWKDARDTRTDFGMTNTAIGITRSSFDDIPF